MKNKYEKKIISRWNLGLIEQHEMIEFMTTLLQAHGLHSENNSENILKFFQRLDSNGDGNISEDEFMKTFFNYEDLVFT